MTLILVRFKIAVLTTTALLHMFDRHSKAPRVRGNPTARRSNL